MTDRRPPPFAARFRTAAGALAAAAIAIGAGVLAGWLLDLPRLTDWVEPAPEAKFNAGLCILLLGLSLRLLHRAPPSRRARLAAHACTAVAVAIAVLSLGETVFGWDLGIDNLVVREPAGALGALAPGKMAPHTAGMVVLAGAALLFVDRRARGMYGAFAGLASAVALGTLFVAEGYLYGPQFFTGPGAYSFTAIPILAGLMALSLGLLAARPVAGFTAVLAAPGSGGRVARRLLPLIALLPIALGALQVGEVAKGLFSEPFALALTMIALIAITTGVVLATAQTIETKEAQESAAVRGQYAAERRLLDALDHLVLPAVELDAGGKVTYANDHLFRTTGYTREEVVGHDWASRFVPGGAEAQDTFRRSLAHGALRVHHDTQVVTKDGRTLFVEWNNTVVRDAAGAVTSTLKVGEDVTARRAAEEALRDLNETLEQRVEQRTAELAEANKELESFSYSVSHDLRAPLRSVDGFARILLDEFAPALEPAAQRYLGLVREGAQRMGQLVDELLALSRLGRQPLRRVRVEPAGLVQECLLELESDYGESARGVVVDALAPCDADPGLLRQVWLNLLANACKFTRERERPEIRVGCRDEDGSVVYFVSDNGAGFDMAYADKLFGVFQRLHRAEDYEGTGVGLALVQRIVHRHGGRIWAEAAVDRGATFHFTLGEETADGPEGS